MHWTTVNLHAFVFQTKVRLEMNLEKLRQQNMKDVEEKEQEMEDLRYSTQKKVVY